MFNIGQFVTDKRTARGYSQSKLGSLSGVSDSEIMRIEKGKRKNPAWQTLCKIAKALDFSPLEIMLQAGYITENDMNFKHKIKGLDRLNTSDMQEVQLFVDFLLSKKTEDKNVSVEVVK